MERYYYDTSPTDRRGPKPFLIFDKQQSNTEPIAYSDTRHAAEKIVNALNFDRQTLQNEFEDKFYDDKKTIADVLDGA